MYYAMQAHWEKFGPPVYMAVAGYLGLIKPDKTDTAVFGDLEELEQMFPGGMIQ